MDINGQQDAEMGVLLGAFGVGQPILGRRIPGGFIATDLNELAGETFGALHKKAVLLSYRLNSRTFPISIFFIEEATSKFGHASLLFNSYSEGKNIRLLLEAATKRFFLQPNETLLMSLCPDWLSLPLKGLVDKRILWEQEINPEFSPDCGRDTRDSIPKLTIFPSVYHFNQPYMKNLLDEALPEVHRDDRVLVLGCGAGLESIFLAKKVETRIDAIDINPIAVLNTRLTARKAGLEARVRAWQSDLFAAVGDRYDVIFFNAPLAVSTRPQSDANRFDFEGMLLRRLFNELPRHLTKSGKLFLMSHGNLDRWIAPGVVYKVRRTFDAVIECAILEVRIRSVLDQVPNFAVTTEVTHPVSTRNANA
jgi:SAM-dependent methyltransferase